MLPLHVELWTQLALLTWVGPGRSERPSFMHSPSVSEYLRRMLHYASC